MATTHKSACLPLCFLLLAVSANAAEPPTAPLASKGAIVFSDDFSAPEPGKAWHVLWPSVTTADGKLNISQIKPEHSAVGEVPMGRKDVVIEFSFQLNGATSTNAVCNDRGYKEGHGGHICRVCLSPRQIFLACAMRSRK